MTVRLEIFLIILKMIQVTRVANALQQNFWRPNVLIHYLPWLYRCSVAGALDSPDLASSIKLMLPEDKREDRKARHSTQMGVIMACLGRIMYCRTLCSGTVAP